MALQMKLPSLKGITNIFAKPRREEESDVD
ncbi:MAG: hypothetical protein RLZZ502_1884, partial [Pseudomonadota bacterium]